MCLLVPWPIWTRLQVTSPKILQKMTILCRLTRYSSTDRVWHRLSAEGIATPSPESDLDDEQIRTMLASPLHLQEREASADRSRVCHSLREKSVSSSSHFGENMGKPVARESTENPVALFSNRRKSSQGTLSDREDLSSEHQQGPGNKEPPFRFSDLENLMKSFLEEHRDYMLAEANSGVQKQACRAYFLDSSVRDLQKQLDSNRLEIYCTNQGFEESRKEQARLHEQLTQRERYFEKLKSEVFMKWENWRELRKCE